MSDGNNTNKNPIFEQIERESQRQSGYIKLQDGELRTLKFNPNKVDMVNNEFSGKITKRVEYKVTDPQTNEGEKILSMAITNARRINKFLEKGRHLLEIERIGSGLDTTYNISVEQ